MEIVSTGLVCSVGWSASSACAAIRAGLAGFEELPYRDDEGEPIKGATVSPPANEERSNLHSVLLLEKALADCLDGVDPLPLAEVPLVVGLGEPDRPGVPSFLPASIIPFVEQELGVRFDPTRSRVISSGHTAGFRALAAAREFLKDPLVPACLVCGVDSYLNPESLYALSAAERLKTGENSDGVIPGEAAAAVLVRRNAGTVRVTGLGFGLESVTVYSPEPLLGLGIAEAARAALLEAGTALHEMDFRLSDVTGESYGFREQSLMVSRLLRVRRENFPVWHCADSIGDTGAAAGIAQLVIAFHAFRRGYAPGRRAICCTSAPLGDRAVAVVESGIGV